MPDFGAFIGWHDDGDLEEWYRQFERADSVAFMIGHRGVSLVLVRGNTTLEAQTALIAPAGQNTQASERRGEAVIATMEQLVIIGLPGMDIKRGDLFRHPGETGRLNWRVVRVEKAVHGMVQAYAEETQ
jgi:hypothetical protein